MPRMRDRILHPEFFTDAKLYDAERESGLPLRLAYEGLWCVADRDGRFEWKPRELKLMILPYDDVDMAETMQALVNYGFIQHYSAEGVECGCVRKFTRWQHVHPKEARSRLPEPPTLSIELPETPCNSRELPGTPVVSTSTFNSTSTSNKHSAPNGAGHPKNGAKRHPSWLAPFSVLWTSGTPPYGQMAKALRDLTMQHGEEQVLQHWGRYLSQTEPRYWSPHRFASTYNAWNANQPIPGIADEPNLEWVD